MKAMINSCILFRYVFKRLPLVKVKGRARIHGLWDQRTTSLSARHAKPTPPPEKQDGKNGIGLSPAASPLIERRSTVVGSKPWVNNHQHRSLPVPQRRPLSESCGIKSPPPASPHATAQP
ncbi:hypothetical protein, partial [Pseudorhodobacter sp.]|uniref:hypothetical protein n=1 Tax=Pseudorhodobacter sp. TaxID=1934400 RepID=UPI00264743B6